MLGAGSHSVEIAIIGAGVIGLAIAAQVARRDRQVYVLEKNETFGLETSSRNSGVIHAGIYYPEGSLKAKMCVEGNALLYEICNKYGIGYKKLGKVVVATATEEIEELELLLESGRRNGAKGLRMLSKRELKELEPHVEALAALFSSSTGIMDGHALMRYFLSKARENGAELAYKSKVIGIEKLPAGYQVTVEDGSGAFSFRTEILINCAGLNSDRIAELAGIDINKAGYKLHYCKGEYFSVGRGKSRLVKGLVYPTPERDRTGVGVHVTLDLDGRMRLGPNVRYIDGIDYKVDESQKAIFYESAKRFLPFLEYEDLEPEMAGIRPKLQGPGEDFRDFVVSHEEDKGLPGLINLVGIESPGLTCAPAIAKHVEGMVNKIL